MAKPDAGPWYKVAPHRRGARRSSAPSAASTSGTRPSAPCRRRSAATSSPRAAPSSAPSPEEERFKYGSLGAEADLGIPYPIFHVLPRVFGDLLPGPGGYRAFGIPWEEGRELPVGFSKKTMGFPRITQTCAICHAASYRTAPDATPVIVPTGPSHTTNAMAFLDFLEAAANDPRWSGDGMMPRDRAQLRPRARRQADLPLPDHPDREEARAGAGAGLRLDPHPRPPGLGARPRRPVQPDQVQPPRAPRRRHRRQRRLPLDLERRPPREHLAQLGRRDPGPARGLHRLARSGIGAPPETVVADMEKHREYLRAKQPPPYPFPIDAALAAQGEAVWAANCADCHAPGGAYFGRTVPIEEIGTDRERFDTWTQAERRRHQRQGAASSASSARRWSRTWATPASRSTASGCARPTCTTARSRR